MAVFIPEEPYEGTKSEAEAEFFYRLKRELDLEDAYVFHSVKLPAHSKKIFGEADFMVASAATAFQDKPRNNREIIIPGELLAAMQANRAGAEGLLPFLSGTMKTADLATKKGAETRSDDK